MTDDLISRQAAIEALGEEPEVWTGKDEYAQGLNNQWHYDKNAIKALPSVDAVPVTWIEGEIKWLKEMDNPFATMSAGQIEAMLKRWKDGDHHEG